MSALVPGRVAPWRQLYWDGRAAGNFIGGGGGAGVILYAALLPSAAAGLVLLGLGLVGIGLLCVWFEIGRPWRAFNVFFHPQSSWMTREALAASLLFVAGAGFVWSASRPLLWLAAGLAAVYVYCQARMLNGGRGIPAWREARLVPLMLATGLAEGCGLALLAETLLEGAAPPAWAAWLLAGLLLVRAVCYASYRRALDKGRAPRRALEVLARFGWKFAGLGALAVALAALGGLAIGGHWMTATAGIIAAVSGWWLKFTIVTRAAFNQGFALPTTPVRGAGSTHPGARPGW